MKKILKILIYLSFIINQSSLCSAQSTPITQGGSNYSISSPYLSEHLFGIQYIQSAATMYLTHNLYAPRILSRTGDTQWTLTVVDLQKGPFMPENEDTTWTLTTSATTGTTTLTASADTFYAGHVDSIWQLVHPADAVTVSGEVVQGATITSSLAVALNQDFTIKVSGLYYGDFTIQRSYDSGVTWRDLFDNKTPDYSSPDFIYFGTETIADADYRLSFTDIAIMQGAPGGPTFTMTAHAFEQEGIAKITAVSDARTATATVLFDFADTEATYKWSEGSFSGVRGYPAAVAFHKERLTFAGTISEPDTLWMSQTDDWHNFLVNNLATSALSYTLAADQVDAIRWLVSHNDLMIGTSGSEWKLSNPSGKPLSPSTFEVKRQSTYGSAAVQALSVNNQVLYVQRNAKKIQRMSFAFEADNWNSEDLTLLSGHLTEGGVIEMAYQRVPISILWSVVGNGDLLALVLEDNQQILGWSRYVFDGDCESVAVIPGSGEDRVLIVVARQIEGSTVRYVEQFMPIDFADQDSAFYVDAGVSFDGGAAVTVTNVTQAFPAVVTAPEHTFSDGDQVQFTSVGGMTELNNNVYSVSTVSGASFEIRDSTDAVDINTVDFTTYTSGGAIEQVENVFATLGHLEDEAVVAAGDGGYAGSYTVASSTVTLDQFYNRTHIGLAYTAKLKPMKLDFLSSGGALQGRTKRISAITLRMFESLSCSIGPTFEDFDSIVFRDADDLLEAATPLFSDDKRILFDGGFETAGDICVQDSLPVPLTVLGLIVEYEAEK